MSYASWSRRRVAVADLVMPLAAQGPSEPLLGQTLPHARQGRSRMTEWVRRLGPGFITGASDDDPSGIATYSQAGAAFSYGLLWTLLFSLPLMAAIQEISARIGRTTGHGIAGNIRRHYSGWLLYPLVFLLVIANTINLGADIGSMGDAVALLIGGPALAYAMVFALACVLSQVFVSYRKFARILKWLTLVLLSYIAVGFFANVRWTDAAWNLLVPSLQFNGNYWTTFIAILGTTISPYLFFWQAAQETEEIEVNPRDKPLKKAPHQAPAQLERIRVDTYVGMGFSNTIAMFIVLAASATLHANHITDVQSSVQAAQALQPVAGRLCFVLFSMGIVGTGLLAVPVLAGSAAYAVGEAFKLPTGLNRKPRQAKGFYAVVGIATALGLAINFPGVQRLTHVTPIKALFWSAAINGIAAVPIMVVMMRMFRNPRIMGRFADDSKLLAFMGWLAALVMALVAAVMFMTWKQ